MANPLVVDVPKDAWLKVATNVTTGNIQTLKFDAMYLQTYRLTGDTGPSLLVDEGARLEIPRDEISASEAIDVYLLCTSADGKVRVDV